MSGLRRSNSEGEEIEEGVTVRVSGLRRSDSEDEGTEEE